MNIGIRRGYDGKTYKQGTRVCIDSLVKASGIM